MLWKQRQRRKLSNRYEEIVSESIELKRETRDVENNKSELRCSVLTVLSCHSLHSSLHYSSNTMYAILNYMCLNENTIKKHTLTSTMKREWVNANATVRLANFCCFFDFGFCIMKINVVFERSFAHSVRYRAKPRKKAKRHKKEIGKESRG